VKVESRLFVLGGALMSLNALAYLVLTGEEAGSIMLTLSFVALLLVGGYLAVLARRPGPRPHDPTEPHPERIGHLSLEPVQALLHGLPPQRRAPHRRGGRPGGHGAIPAKPTRR
jgi:hypothetical protein